MNGLHPRLRISRYFVTLVAEIREPLTARGLDPGNRIFVGQAFGRTGVKHGIRFQGQLVPGDVGRPQHGGGLDVSQGRIDATVAELAEERDTVAGLGLI